MARFFQTYSVQVMIAALVLAMSILSDSFLTYRNILNILNQNAPLAIMASARIRLVRRRNIRSSRRLRRLGRS